eukprot:8363550-Lingulodinium_polyedra.AAC.1
MPPTFWDDLAAAYIGEACSGRQLQMKVLQSAWAAYGFMHAGIFHPASQLPWSLCQGDVEANLA